MKRRKKYFGLCYGIFLTAFTAYALLDTFVIPRRMEKSVLAADASLSEEKLLALQEGNSVSTKTSSAKSSGESGESRTIQESVEARIREKTSGSSGAESSENSGEKSFDTKSSSASSKGGGKGKSGTESEKTETAEDSGESAGTLIGSYEDQKSRISVRSYRYEGSTVYVADITLTEAASLRTAFANGSYGRNIKALSSVTAEENDAVLAINGDFYGSRQSGYVIRNGELYRDSGSENEDLAIMKDGSFRIVSESDYSASELLSSGAEQVFSFGPALLKNSEIQVSENEEVGMAMASNPRTAIGILGENHYVFVVSDGRTEESAGLSLYELSEFLQELGCKTAYNLDGGGSSTMVFQGEVVNKPTTGGDRISERAVSDIVYIKKS